MFNVSVVQSEPRVKCWKELLSRLRTMFRGRRKQSFQRSVIVVATRGNKALAAARHRVA